MSTVGFIAIVVCGGIAMLAAGRLADWQDKCARRAQAAKYFAEQATQDKHYRKALRKLDKEFPGAAS